MKEKLKKFIKKFLPEFALRMLANRYMRGYFTSPEAARNSVGSVDSDWKQRIQDVIASPDNGFIPRVADAGQLEEYYITMHNGVRVCANGYYGNGNLNMLIENKGVHEPQEERAFEAVIDCLPEQCCMLELGAYWSFYSLSLLQKRPKARCYLVEPEFFNMTVGKLNFRLNGRRGTFVQALVGAEPKREPRTISVDSFCQEHGITHLDILHADIQGYELDMLAGASNVLSRGLADYIFISTHSNHLHQECLKEIISNRYVILAEADLDETFSYDGLIVAKRADLVQPEKIEISKKPRLVAQKREEGTD